MSAIPPAIESLLELFTTRLAEVRFADLDGQALARCVEEVESAAISLATAQLTLDAARAALQDKQDLLLQRAQRALAYARVYAETDEGLGRELDAVSLPRPTRKRPEELVLSADPQPAARPRGRPRKAAAPRAAEQAPAEAPMLAVVSAPAE